MPDTKQWTQEEMLERLNRVAQLQSEAHDRLYVTDPHYFAEHMKDVWYEGYAEKSEYKTSMEFWWPLVKGTEGVNMPATYLVPVSPLDVWTLGGGEYVENYTSACLRMQKLLEIYLRPDKNYFIRSYYHSAKHERKVGMINSDTPFCVSMELIKQILEASLIKDLPVSGLAFREYIELEKAFIAFQGLKICKEMRAIVRDGQVKLLPYWPEKAIQFFGHIEEPANWQLGLKMLMKFSMDDKKEIVRQASLLSKNLLKIHDSWTLDFAKGVDGKYYFIDAAVAERSWLGEEEDYEPYG